MYLKFRKPGKKNAKLKIEMEETSFEEIVEIEKRNNPEMEKEPLTVEETHINEAVRIVVKKTMEILQPLLDKLGEAVAQQKKEAEANKETDLADHLTKLHAAAVDRLALQEQKVAVRMGKVQARIAKTK